MKGGAGRRRAERLSLSAAGRRPADPDQCGQGGGKREREREREKQHGTHPLGERGEDAEVNLLLLRLLGVVAGGAVDAGAVAAARLESVRVGGEVR